MSTIFIAVQCIQCSTMQVKQQKKSSNKWVCAVCNQRQSFRRIHARGYLARDLRKFVQEFNLSRSVQEASHNASVTGRSDEFLVGSEIGDSSSCGGIACWLGKRRMDWSEYLDPKEDDHRADAGEGATVAKGIGGSGTVVEQGLSKWRKYLEDEDRGDGDNPFKQEKSHLFLSVGDNKVEDEVHPDFQ